MVYGLWTNPLVLWSLVCGLTLQAESVMEGRAYPSP